MRFEEGLEKFEINCCSKKCAKTCGRCLEKAGVTKSVFKKEIRDKGFSTELLETKCPAQCEKLLEINERYFLLLWSGRSAWGASIKTAPPKPSLLEGGALVSFAVSGSAKLSRHRVFCGPLACLRPCAKCLKEEGVPREYVRELVTEGHQSLTDIKKKCPKGCRRFISIIQEPFELVEKQTYR